MAIAANLYSEGVYVMALVNAPLLSLDASGKLGGAIVFSKWKGRQYVRSLVKPANPKSGKQTGMRGAFKFLAQTWASLSAANHATWEERADASIVSPFNAYMSLNQFRMRNFLGLSIEDPPLAAGTPAVIGTTVATAGVRSITLDIPITTVNDGWCVAIYRSLSSSFSTAFDNMIGIIYAPAATTYYWVDTPLEPDTYYYNFRDMTDQGLLGAEDGEVNAVVT